LAPARDGAFIKLGRADNIPLGTIKLPEGINEVAFTGGLGCLSYNLDGETIRIPEGNWLVNSWTIKRKDENGLLWTLTGDSTPSDNMFKVEKGQKHSLDIGEPVKMKLKKPWSLFGGYSFELSLIGSLGERVDIRCSDWRTFKPKLLVQNEDGSYKEILDLDRG